MQSDKETATWPVLDHENFDFYALRDMIGHFFAPSFKRKSLFALQKTRRQSVAIAALLRRRVYLQATPSRSPCSR